MFQFDGIEVKWMKSRIPLVILFIIIGLIATPFFIPSNVYKNLIHDRLEQTTGLDFSFQGGFSFGIFPAIRLEADDIAFSGNLASGVETIGSIEKVVLDVDLLPILTGNVHLNDFLLQSPNITINGDFTPFIPDWLRSNLSTARKEDIRYLEIFLHFIEDSIFNIARIKEGTIVWKKTEAENFDAKKLNLSIEKKVDAKDFTISGNVYVNDRSVDLAMKLERPDEFLRGFRSKLSFELDSGPLRIDFKGNAAHRQSFVSQGDMRIEVPSSFDFCNWLNPPDECHDTESRVLITSVLKLRDQRLQIDDTVYSDGDFELSVNGAIDFKTAIPDVTGTVIVPLRPVKSLENTLYKLKKTNFNNLMLDTFNANVDFKYQGVSLPSGDVLAPNVNVQLDGGHLSVSIDKLKIFGGLSNFRVRWHKGADEGYMDLRFDTRGMDMESLQKGFGKNINMDGALKTSFEIQSQGSTYQKLIETARAHGEFSILDGAFYHPDVVKALNGAVLNQFQFAEIKGRLGGQEGQISIKDIFFIAPFVTVTGVANYDLVQDTLQIQLTSRIPERTDPSGLVKTEAQEGFVSVSGPLDNLVLSTSANEGGEIPQADGLHSGLIPYTSDEKTISDDGNIVIKETDLFD